MAALCRKRCFISNLSFKTSWQDLKDKFREVGNVVYANVTRDENGEGSAWFARLAVSYGIGLACAFAQMSWMSELTRFICPRQVQGLGHCGV